jgi:hypothetical protein
MASVAEAWMVKSPSEFIELSTAHARKQFEAMTAQTKLDFGLFMRRERVHFPFGSRYGAEFLYCLGSAGT